MKTILFSLLQALILSVLLQSPVYAADQGISKQQAMNIAQKKSPGRVLSVKHKGSQYRVKTLNTRGEVRIIVIDSKTGKVISGR